MLHDEYLNAGSLFILNTKLVYGKGMMLSMCWGLTRILFFPIGILIFAAYFCKFYGDPKVGNHLMDSGFNAFPL